MGKLINLESTVLTDIVHYNKRDTNKHMYDLKNIHDMFGTFINYNDNHNVNNKLFKILVELYLSVPELQYDLSLLIEILIMEIEYIVDFADAEISMYINSFNTVLIHNDIIISMLNVMYSNIIKGGDFLITRWITDKEIEVEYIENINREVVS